MAPIRQSVNREILAPSPTLADTWQTAAVVEFRERLQQAVNAAILRGKTQQQIEQASGLGRGYLTRLLSGERGKRPLSVDMIRRLAGALEVPFEELAAELAPGARLPVTQGLTPTLAQSAGYSDAEFLAGRMAPKLDFACFKWVRDIRLPGAPVVVTPELVLDLARIAEKYLPKKELIETAPLHAEAAAAFEEAIKPPSAQADQARPRASRGTKRAAGGRRGGASDDSER